MSTPDLNAGQPRGMKLECFSVEAPSPTPGLRPRPRRNSRRRDRLTLIVIVILISILLVFGIRKARHSPLPTTSAGRLEGQLAPDFTLQSLNGKTIKLSDFRGKAVLLNLWATDCVPCRVEMPWFVDLEKKYGSQGFEILGVAMDNASPLEMSSFAQKLRVNYPVLVGKEEVGAQYGGIDYLPSSFYISRDGKILVHVFGLISRSEIERNIQKALAQHVEEKS